MSNCSSNCRTGDHATFGECMRAKSLRVAYCNSASGADATTQKQLDRDLAAYADARRQGIQPSSIRRSFVDAAVKKSNETGVAHRADTI